MFTHVCYGPLCCVGLICFGDGGVYNRCMDAKAIVCMGPCFTCLHIHIYIYMHNVTELVVVCKGCWYSCFLSIV